MPIPLQELLKWIPSDKELRARRTKERLNSTVREVLRKETGLLLSRHSREPEGGPQEARDQATVPIFLKPGLPVSLAKMDIPEDRWLPALLRLWRNRIQDLHDASDQIEKKLIPALLKSLRGQELVAGRDRHLAPARDLARTLLDEMSSFNLVQWILEVDEDVLGAYFHGPSQPILFAQGILPRIEIYWGVIGVIAMGLAVRIEDLTAVVLAHELAHGYTHLGYDIDGERWTEPDFANSDHRLKEGLAQFYTHQVTQRLDRQAPGSVRHAYEALLKEQPPAYQTHLPWIKEFTSEEVRQALLETRRRGPGLETDFMQSLEKARTTLRGRRRNW